MITAKEARRLTRDRRVYVELLKEAEKRINAAIDAGAYVCEMTLDHRVDNAARIMLVDELEKHGYLVVKKDIRETRNSEPYFYIMYISWEQKQNAEGGERG